MLRYWWESEGVAVYRDQFVVVVMPAYNAEATLERTHREVLDQGVVDLVIVVDDCGRDRTHEIAARLPRTIALRHDRNLGYGGNQKTCYRLALEHGADIVVMVHPDYHYTRLLIPAMCSIIAYDLYQVVLGSRILGKGALKGGMPLYKYFFNRFLTFSQNLLINQKLSKYFY